jgi:hypothetical protein
MPEINFQQIRPFNGGVREAFEELCCQIFRRLSTPEVEPKSAYQRFRGAGGDGGVEALWISPNGEKWGLQAKYFDGLGDSQFIQMAESLRQAVGNHPEIRKYTFCIPFNPTGPTAQGRRGKSQSEKLRDWLQNAQQELQTNGLNIVIEVWAESILRDRLLAVDINGGLRRYWFDSNVMGWDWFGVRLDEAKVQAGRRYTPRLSVDVPAFAALEAFSCTDKWRKRTEILLASLRKTISSWHQAISTSSSLPEDGQDLAASIFNQLSQLEIELREASSWDQHLNLEAVSSNVEHLLQESQQAEKIFLDDLIANHGDNADTPGFRQFESEYNVRFPAAKLDTSRELVTVLRKLEEWLESPDARLPRSKVMLLRGPAGVGKTHAIIDHALHRYADGQLCLVFYGEDFAGGEPWEVMVRKLGLPGDVGRDEFWSMINTIGESAGIPALICIDALNESQDRSRWKQAWLPTLRQQITQFSWLKLCISCRDTYLDEVIEDESEILYFEHNGFVGREFEAIQRFFEFYKLKPPITPLLQREFANPLFLHLVCIGLQDEGLAPLPLGSLGFTDILRLILDSKNKSAAQVCGYDFRDNKVYSAVEALARKMSKLRTRILPREIAQDIVGGIFSTNDHTRSLFLQLEKEGIISSLSRKERPFGPRQWFCRFTFERIGDFLIALSVINEIETRIHAIPQSQELQPQASIISFIKNYVLKYFNETARTNSTQQTSDNTEELLKNRGVFEALSIILPERFQLELADVLDTVNRVQVLLPIIFSGFEWRSPSSFFHRTEFLIYEGLRNSQTAFNVMSALFGIVPVPNHPLNAEFIDRINWNADLTTRDPFWNLTLRRDFEGKGRARQLIEWSLKADLSAFSEETARLWSLFLAWCCASSDRRVRDRASKGLTRFFLVKPTIIKPIILHFAKVDDDYILERVSFAAYSTLLRLKDNDFIKDTAEAIYTEFFAQDFVPDSVLTRDWLRLIVELAYQQNILDQAISTDRFRPPYASHWPIAFPTEEDVSHLVNEKPFRRNMNLSDSAIGTDFARYVVEPRITKAYDLESLEISREDVFRWFIQRVSELGYPGKEQQCYQYDLHLLSKYGGGRSRAGWAERLGKKYYWILLRQLAGIISDHVPRRIEVWGDERKPILPKVHGIDFRDIDLTDLRSFLPRSPEYLAWWKSVSYDFNAFSHLDHARWIWNEDFLNATQVIEVSDNSNENWVYLSSYLSKRDTPKLNEDDERPYRNFSILLKSAFVPYADLKRIRQAARSADDFYNRSHLDEPYDYRLLIGEYPNTLPFQQKVEVGDIDFICSLPGTDKAQHTCINLLRGKEFEYDFSEEELILNLLVPAPDLVDFGKLEWDGLYGWIDSASSLQVVAINNEQGSGLLIKKIYVQQFLASKSLALIYFDLQRKYFVNGFRQGPGSHELRSIYEFSDNQIRALSQSAQKYQNNQQEE